VSNLRAVMKELESLGSEQTRKIFARHGATSDKLFGVKVGDLKKVVKKIKGEHELALELYATGNYDAMYLAGMVADGSRMTKKQLNDWTRQATWQMVSEYTIPGVATESDHGFELALKWIDAKKEHVAASGWATLAAIATVWPDDRLDVKEYRGLVTRVLKEIDGAPNRVRYTMNGFVIAAGTSIAALNATAKKAAKKLGNVKVDMHGTACKVPLATEYMAKIEGAGRLGKKRKTAKC
jgi:hypothetical protein